MALRLSSAIDGADEAFPCDHFLSAHGEERSEMHTEPVGPFLLPGLDVRKIAKLPGPSFKQT
eukprot:4166906-Heterocapsa_arctica.AAC.1